jgi:hypothetical protein
MFLLRKIQIKGSWFLILLVTQLV